MHCIFFGQALKIQITSEKIVFRFIFQKKIQFKTFSSYGSFNKVTTKAHIQSFKNDKIIAKKVPSLATSFSLLFLRTSLETSQRLKYRVSIRSYGTETQFKKTFQISYTLLSTTAAIKRHNSRFKTTKS